MSPALLHDSLFLLRFLNLILYHYVVDLMMLLPEVLPHYHNRANKVSLFCNCNLSESYMISFYGYYNQFFFKYQILYLSYGYFLSTVSIIRFQRHIISLLLWHDLMSFFSANDLSAIMAKLDTSLMRFLLKFSKKPTENICIINVVFIENKFIEKFNILIIMT